MASPLREDLDHILSHTERIWGEFRNQKIFITGGTGFFGCWLLESFAWANDKLGLNASALILSRNPERFQEKAPHLAAHPAIHFHAGDVRNFDFPDGHFSHVIHASNEAINYATAHYNRDNLQYFVCDCNNIYSPNNTFDVIIAFEIIEHLSKPEIFLNEAWTRITSG